MAVGGGGGGGGGGGRLRRREKGRDLLEKLGEKNVYKKL